jgi:sugar lactone lactonase YvrE
MKYRFLAFTIALILLSSTARAHVADGQLYVVDSVNNRVFYVNPDDGTVAVVLNADSGLNGPGAIGFSLWGNMLVANTLDDTLLEFGENLGLGPEVVLTGLDGLSGPGGGNGVVIGPGTGDVFVANVNSGEIRVFDRLYGNGAVFADTGDGLLVPAAMTVLLDGHMLVADRGMIGNVFHLDGDTGVTTPFDTIPGATLTSIVARDNGDIYVLTHSGNIFRYVGGLPASRVLMGNYASGHADGGLALSPDHSVLYHVNALDGEVKTIDPDTGVSSVLATIDGNPIALTVVGSQYAPGTFSGLCGEPLAGTGGVRPKLQCQDEPRIGQSGVLKVHDFVGGSLIYLFLGFGYEEWDFMGGEFHIDLAAPWTSIMLAAPGVPGAAGEGDVNLPFTLPNDPALVGTRWALQAVGIDAAGPFGVSMSMALYMYVGK